MLAVLAILFNTPHTVSARFCSRSVFLSVPSTHSISPSQLHAVRTLDGGARRRAWAVLLAWWWGKWVDLIPPLRILEL